MNMQEIQQQQQLHWQQQQQNPHQQVLQHRTRGFGPSRCNSLLLLLLLLS